MKYSKKAKSNYIRTMQKRIQYYRKNPAELIAKGVSISKGNSKIGKCLNVSQAPIFSCANCSGCSDFCYDVKANLQYANVLDARARNLVIWEFDPNFYFAEIHRAMANRKGNFYFRFHVAGDIPNMDYFRRMIETARKFPYFIIWTYTKNYFIVNEFVRMNGGNRATAIPANLKIMFSEWDGMPLINPYNFPIFTCKLEQGNKNHDESFFDSLYKCPGNCDLCKPSKEFPCGKGCIKGVDTYADEH